ncbi:MAG: dihydrodipicolinate synthase family protein, partial [Pedobacter sp.]|nr:dihydrodipicolinate synthase family protein [Pedobacter sp.]
QVADMVNLCNNGDFKNATKIHLSVIEFIHLAFLEGNPAGVKAALQYLGVCSNLVRLPLVKASSSLEIAIVKELERLK